MQKRIAAVLIISLAFLFSASCSEDPQAPIIKETRDDVIKKLLAVYADPMDPETMAAYRALLHSQYFFMFHEADVEPGGSPIMTRFEDIQSTEWIFDNQTMLLLEIPEAGSWDERNELGGEPCTDCWETTRQYYIRVQFGDETTIFQSPPDRAYAIFIVAPDENDSNKWVLRAMYDLGI